VFLFFDPRNTTSFLKKFLETRFVVFTFGRAVSEVALWAGREARQATAVGSGARQPQRPTGQRHKLQLKKLETTKKTADRKSHCEKGSG